MPKEKIIVKYKFINKFNFSGEIYTQDFRYALKISKSKIVKWLIKNNYRFSIGIRENSLTNNLNYIEVYSNNLLSENYYDEDRNIRKFLGKYSIKKPYCIGKDRSE